MRSPPQARAWPSDQLPKAAAAAAFNRNNSKFYRNASFSDKLLEVEVGEAVMDLDAHPCRCDQTISSLKASQDARWTKIYDAVDLNSTAGSWWIASGAEIRDLDLFSQPEALGGELWDGDISSIEVAE
jgi:hypothetical protein